MGTYLLVVVLLNVPAVQTSLSAAVAGALGETLGSEVRIGRIDCGMLNRLVADDIVLYDREGNDLFKATRLSATFQFLPLFRGKIVIDNIRLFSFSARLCREHPDKAPNYRFLLDRLSSDEPAKSFVDLRINSILLRRGHISHDLLYVPHDSTGFSPAHLDIDDLNADISIKALNTDSVNIYVRKFGFREQSGLQLKRLSGRLEANRRHALLSGFTMQLPHSVLKADSLSATFRSGSTPSPFDIRPESLQFRGQLSSSVLWPADFAPFLPALEKLDEPIHLSASLQGTNKEITVRQLRLRTQDEGLNALLTTKFSQNTTKGTRDWNADAQIYSLAAQASFLRQLAGVAVPEATGLIPFVERLRYICYHGTASRSYGATTLSGTLQCSAGQITLSALLDAGRRFDVALRTRDFRAGSLLPPGNALGSVSFAAKAQGRLADNNDGIQAMRAEGTFDLLEFKQYAYHHLNLNIDAHHSGKQWNSVLTWDDPHGHLTAEATLDRQHAQPAATLDARLKGFAPHALHLTADYRQTSFDGRLKASLRGTTAENLEGNILLTDFRMKEPGDTCRISRTELKSRSQGRDHRLTLESDFATAQMEGTFEFRRLPEILRRQIHLYLPSLISIPTDRRQRTTPLPADNIRLSAQLRDARPLRKLLALPLSIERPADLSAYMDSHTGDLRIDASCPGLKYGDEHLRDIRLTCSDSLADGLTAHLTARRMMQGHPVSLALHATASQDHLRSVLSWDNNRPNVYRGTVATDTQFYKESDGTTTALRTRILPTDLILNDSLWHIHASTLTWRDHALHIDRFLVNQGVRHLSIDGHVSASPEDTLTARLKDINLEYVFDIINFHAVEFGGHATGRVYATQLTTAPQMDANLDVRRFTFNDGDMGDMNIRGWWNQDEKSIHLDAQMSDPPHESRTRVEGTVTPGQGPGTGLDLRISTDRINLHFLNEYTRGIFTGLEGRATGWARVFGPFKQIDLEGNLVIDEATLPTDVLGTRYTLENDTVVLTPGHIRILNARAYDLHGGPGTDGHHAIVDAHLHHDHFSSLTYDIDVRTRNFLGYNRPEFGDEVFCGTAYATGLIRLNGRPGELNVDIQARPESGTIFTYNSSTPETVTSREFIRFISPACIADTTRATGNPVPKSDIDTEPETGPASDMRLNFNLDITPDATVRILMDARSGDYISLNGYSRLRATYYNKGRFQMYGTFRVDHGLYKLSLQDVIRKDFRFTPGGTLVFGGEPFQADLNLQAVHTVPSVSLNDLSSGTTFSQNNVRVNCIMNLGGKARSPHISFDFDLPNVNEDEKQMVRSLISTDEEKNMQIIYLLGIGRFYTYDYNNPDQSQSSVAMKSLLSSTLSGQLNQMLSSIVGNGNWNIGTNLSTGDTGWSDMDVEGLLSGRLLDNRLLINGNFGYRENTTTNSNFIGDFDLQWLLTRNGNISLKAYSETNERYFTKSTLTTQGIGLKLKKDFISWKDLFRRRKARKP